MEQTPETLAAAAPLDDVLITDRLQVRRERDPDYERENRALSELARAMTDSPAQILQRLAEIAMDVCAAGSAGISLMREEGGHRRFHWPAIVGAWKEHVGGGMPYHASPCGVVVERNDTQLFRRPEHHFTYFVTVEHPIEEALLAPFHVDGEAIGTVWVISHDPAREFDQEDARLLGSLSRFAGAAYQITAGGRTDEALRESDERLRIAKAAANLGLHDFNVQAGTVEWDNRTRELFGVEPDAPITYEAWRESVHPEDRESAERAVTRALDPAGDGRYWAQYRVVNLSDGITRWLEATGQTTFVDGKARRLVGAVQDITKRKKAEESLREADRRKDEFLATLAHELRNPMAALRMALGVLVREEATPRQAEQMKGIIERQFAHLARLIDDLLDVSRITRGKIDLDMRPVDLGVIVADAAGPFREECAASGLSCEVSVARQPVLVQADAFRLAQVIGNLLNNAHKYTPRGGEIQVVVQREDGDAVVRVRDTGIGIPPELLPRIFEMFVQVGGTEGSSGGLGIGLALAQSIMAMHGGRIDAYSEGPGRGSEFVVRMPAVSEHVAVRDRPAHAAPAAAAPEKRVVRVLVVDDNRDALEAVAAMLRILGHDVGVAENGEEALRKAAAMRPELVLLDIGLPGIDGYETAHRLRAQPGGREVHLVAVTGWGQTKDKQRAAEAGFDAHLTKPVNPDQLEQLLSERTPPSGSGHGDSGGGGRGA